MVHRATSPGLTADFRGGPGLKPLVRVNADRCAALGDSRAEAPGVYGVSANPRLQAATEPRHGGYPERQQRRGFAVMVVGRLGALLPRHAPSLARLKPWVFEEPGGRAALGERRETGEGGLSAIRFVGGH